MKRQFQAEQISAAEKKGYFHIVLLADPHFPGRITSKKEEVLKRIATWEDVDFAVILGDLCEISGTPSEYKSAAHFLDMLQKPFFPISGNHDCFFSNYFSPASPSDREKKIQLFMETFQLPQMFDEIELPNQNLFFLSVDSLTSHYYTAISEPQLDWFEERLKKCKKPAIVFFHSPVFDEKFLKMAPFLENYTAQPYSRVTKIVRENPQINLWVSGHIHLAPTNPFFFHDSTFFEGRRLNLFNCDISGMSIFVGAGPSLENHGKFWTQSLFLYPDKAISRFFYHGTEQWIENWTRNFPLKNI
ncbi:MAG: metallophosphoesterase [Candidatus Riflebacteria bacterium]|nr:metallophosphoesterase [Candidatus Riflebacteria bacterium]